jgi:hypothetical protein
MAWALALHQRWPGPLVGGFPKRNPPYGISRGYCTPNRVGREISRLFRRAGGGMSPALHGPIDDGLVCWSVGCRSATHPTGSVRVLDRRNASGGRYPASFVGLVAGCLPPYAAPSTTVRPAGWWVAEAQPTLSGQSGSLTAETCRAGDIPPLSSGWWRDVSRPTRLYRRRSGPLVGGLPKRNPPYGFNELALCRRSG